MDSVRAPLRVLAASQQHASQRPPIHRTDSAHLPGWSSNLGPQAVIPIGRLTHFARQCEMKIQLERQPTHPIQGQMLRLSEHHAVAIYLRDGVVWVADFIDGQGALVDANTWFRFNCGNLANSHALRRMALESAMPIPTELGARIEALHATAVHRRGEPLSELVAAITAYVRRSRLATLLVARFRRRKAHAAPQVR